MTNNLAPGPPRNKGVARLRSLKEAGDLISRCHCIILDANITPEARFPPSPPLLSNGNGSSRMDNRWLISFLPINLIESCDFVYQVSCLVWEIEDFKEIMEGGGGGKF